MVVTNEMRMQATQAISDFMFFDNTISPVNLVLSPVEFDKVISVLVDIGYISGDDLDNDDCEDLDSVLYRELRDVVSADYDGHSSMFDLAVDVYGWFDNRSEFWCLNSTGDKYTDLDIFEFYNEGLNIFKNLIDNMRKHNQM